MVKRKMRRLRWLGTGRREALGYVWNRRGAVVAVRDGDAATLLAHEGQFEDVKTVEMKKDGE